MNSRHIRLNTHIIQIPIPFPHNLLNYKTGPYNCRRQNKDYSANNCHFIRVTFLCPRMGTNAMINSKWLVLISTSEWEMTGRPNDAD